MKTFLKLLVAVSAFGFATANAEYTSEQKAAAIKIVTDAVATGDEAEIKKAVSQQVAAFPELAGDIVAAALRVDGISASMRVVVVTTAAFTAPKELAAIRMAIRRAPGLGNMEKITLRRLAKGAIKGEQAHRRIIPTIPEPVS